MKVLVGCEFSGIVREAFKKRGHLAVSCDLYNDSEIESDGHHIRSDIRYFLKAGMWDLGIFFPPCDHLCVSGARWFKMKAGLQEQALDLIARLMLAPIPKIAIENPIGVISSRIRKPDQIVQPWQFGHGETKTTCLWLKNLPKLKPTKIVEGREQRIHHMAPGPQRGRERSRTYQGIAEAMAAQWG